MLFEVANNYIKPMREKFLYFMNNKNLVDEILKQGAIKAQKYAREYLKNVRKAIGVEN